MIYNKLRIIITAKYVHTRIKGEQDNQIIQNENTIAKLNRTLTGNVVGKLV